MSKCLVCFTEITALNDSKEHVIPNAIGGKMVIKGFLCRRCNSETGDKWDAEISKQLNLFCLLLGGVERDRGFTPTEIFSTISGKEVRLANEGVLSIAHPEYKTEEIDGKVQFTFKTGSMNQAEQFVRNLCKKKPSLNQQELMDNLTFTNSYLNGDALVFKPQFGGENSGRSLVKTILAFAANVGIDPNSCEKAKDYLLDDAEPCFGYYYSNDVILNRDFPKPAHFLAVHADPLSGYVIGYLEYFGIFRVISMLSESYNGVEVKESYYIYPEDSMSGVCEFELPSDKEVIAASYNYEKYDEKILHEAFAFFLSYCRKKDFEREQDRVITQAWNDAKEKFGLEEGGIFSEEQAREVSNHIANSVTPFFMNQIYKNNKR